MEEHLTSLSRESRPEGANAADALRDRLCADLIGRWQRGERVPVEAYLRQHPDLESSENAFELILTEVVLRHEQGEAVALQEFLWRFPRFEERLRRHFTLHAGLAAVAQSQATDVPILPGDEILAPAALPVVPGYEIVEKIGRGGIGIVYKAREESLNRYVAIKVLREDRAHAPDQLARFLREARTASALNHPGICTVHALSQQGDHPCIVMELIEGVTLRALVRERPQPDVVARLIGQAALALAAAHAAGVVHRDIKPENIMARSDGHVKVVDFGLARLLPHEFPANVRGWVGAGNDSGSTPGSMAGTLTYMSPEQTRSEPVGSASDVFSLGIVAYELLTGRHPFAADSPLETFTAISTQPVITPRRFVPTLSVDLEALLLQMLEKDASLRPTAAEIGAALDRQFQSTRPRWQDAVRDFRVRKSIGRNVERDVLWAAFEAADQGRPVLFCVSGEPGIGKTTLVEDWLQELQASGLVAGIGRGQCSERLAGTGAYLPILEALEGLLRGEVGSLASQTLRDRAETWYAQVAPSPRDALAEMLAVRAETATEERLKREFLAFVREIGRSLPLVLFLDDLHWADASTVDLLAFLGRRVTGLRLLVVATFRPAEMHAGKNPFVSVQLELQRHGVCRVLPLSFLTQLDVESYLSQEFPKHQFPPDFATRLHAQTEGNPLFLVELVRHLRDSGVISCRNGCWELMHSLPDFQKELPDSVRSLIRRQTGQLDEADQRLLSVGSVQGYEFDAVVVAGVLTRSAAEIEERLALLERTSGLVLLVREQEFPDGTVTLRYRFVHVLYQNSLYGALSPSRRAEWSAAVAEALLAHHGEQSAVVASEAALLFEKARNWMRAAEGFYLAARNPFRLHAHRETAVLARRGLEMLLRLPETPERARQEARLQFVLGLALQQSEGFAAPGVVEAYRRARALSHVEIEPASRSPLLWGLWSFYILRGEHRAAREIAGELSQLARSQNDPLALLAADHSSGYSLMMLGQPAAAWSHLGRDLPDETQAVYGRDMGIPFRAHGSVVLWLRGFPDQAVARCQQAVARGRDRRDLYGLSIALFNAAKVHQLRREPQATAEYARSLLILAEEQAFPVWLAAGTILAGWAETRLGDWSAGVTRIRQGIAAYLANGAAMMHPYFLGLLAKTLGEGGLFAEGLEVLNRALAIVEQTDEHYYEAELQRLRGEFLLQAASLGDGVEPQRDAASTCFQSALAIARQQQALSLELRVVVSAANLAGKQRSLPGAQESAKIEIQQVCAQFSEGFETADWLAAVALRDSP
ncbi:MAG: protein kinase [Planctomycetes bacterium]|nr:protein kinase [Planctomycetota bacterium]